MRAVSSLTGWVGMMALLASCGVDLPTGQGKLFWTGNTMDLALVGPGFFALEGSWGTEYTRDGQFEVAANGNLVALNDRSVLGYPATEDGGMALAAGPLRIGVASTPARPTRVITIRGNLDPDASFPVPPAFDPLDPAWSSNVATRFEIHDDLGRPLLVQLFLRRVGPGAWDFYALSDTSTVGGGAAGALTEIATGVLSFDTSGRLVVVGSATWVPPGKLDPLDLRFDFGDPIAQGGTGAGGMTQVAGSGALAGASTITFAGADGAGPGWLASLRVDGQGRVLGHFTNGDDRTLAQLAVALFPHPGALRNTSDAHFAETIMSGPAALGRAGEGGRASVVAGTLEVMNCAPGGGCLPGW